MKRRGLVILLVAIILLLLMAIWWWRKSRSEPLPEFGDFGGEDLVEPLPVVDVDGTAELLDNGLMEMLPGIPTTAAPVISAGKALARTDEPSGSPDWVVT
ncbi:MAG: hypothetical protein A2Y72_03305 [Chloroflexi bacterium RBG_13_53_26]|nr:MAG: hypothetical protein A2Y72_03305 [Chloroflexi bacterium RBG_13_53_26]